MTPTITLLFGVGRNGGILPVLKSQMGKQLAEETIEVLPQALFQAVDMIQCHIFLLVAKYFHLKFI